MITGINTSGKVSWLVFDMQKCDAIMNWQTYQNPITEIIPKENLKEWNFLKQSVPTRNRNLKNTLNEAAVEVSSNYLYLSRRPQSF